MDHVSAGKVFREFADTKYDGIALKDGFLRVVALHPHGDPFVEDFQFEVVGQALVAKPYVFDFDANGSAGRSCERVATPAGRRGIGEKIGGPAPGWALREPPSPAAISS